MTADLPLNFAQIPHPAPKTEAERQAALENPGFGTVFTDHMVVIRWTEGKGWHSASVEAKAPFMIDPAAAVLHYAQEIFEGMKAYRTEDDRVVLFRPEENAARFNASARRMAMPEIPQDLFIEAVNQLVRIDRAWVPAGEGSLYLRPFLFASEAFLGVRAAREYIFCVIASPVGPYFKGGAKPLSIWLSSEYSRAADRGTGAAKCGGNYAGSLSAQSEASKQGCDQVAFLDAAEHKWIEELGGMNLFFVFEDGKIVTPALGTILPGITRKSLIALAQSHGMPVEERRYSFDEWKADAESGRLKETFACGTAAVVAGIGQIKFADGAFQIADGQIGPVTARLQQELVGIQRGRLEDKFGWVREV